MKKLLSAILILAMVLSLMPALSLRSQAAETSYAEFWVDPDTGDDANEGTQAAPFKTITKAKEIVSTIAPAMTGDIIVHLGGGTYTLEDTINFTAADSGCNGFKVIYKAVEGETPLLSGGTLISNWEVHDADKNIFVADVPEGLEDGRHFFVDGEYATHAMTEDAPIDWKIMSSYGYVSPTVDSADNEEYVIMDLGEETRVGQLVLYPYTLIKPLWTASTIPYKRP